MHCLLGDCHTKKLELQGDEAPLIDMDTLALGHPVFELASMYNAFVGFHEIDSDACPDFPGYDSETARRFGKNPWTTCAMRIRTDRMS